LIKYEQVRSGNGLLIRELQPQCISSAAKHVMN